MHLPKLPQLAALAVLCYVSVSDAAGPNSLCSTSEQTVFSCRYKAKIASVCAASDTASRLQYVQYRFGGAKVEISIPAMHPFDLDTIRGEVSSGAHGGAETLVFKNADYDYRLQTGWDMRNAKYDSAEIQVFRGGKLLSRFECTPTTQLGSDATGLRRLITASGMRPLQ